jgi:nucleoside-diphosphate-sugar epimerase
MRVLVTGAAGLVGSAVLTLLAERGIPVTALVLDETPGLLADRVVVGDAGSPEPVDEALRGVTDVIHLAAIPTPLDDPGEKVFGRNTLATFTVLDRAGQAGVERAVIASSYAICGLPFARTPLRLPYLPIDASIPLQITDPYALSKQVDEATSLMIHRRYGMSVVALRLPFVGTAEGRLSEAAARFARSPQRGAADVWSYLDAGVAGGALAAGRGPATAGHHVVYVAAPTTLAPQPSEWLLDTFHPGVPRPAFPGRSVPIDLAPALDLLDFQATFVFPVRA